MWGCCFLLLLAVHNNCYNCYCFSMVVVFHWSKKTLFFFPTTHWWESADQRFPQITNSDPYVRPRVTCNKEYSKLNAFFAWPRSDSGSLLTGLPVKLHSLLYNEAKTVLKRVIQMPRLTWQEEQDKDTRRSSSVSISSLSVFSWFPPRPPPPLTTPSSSLPPPLPFTRWLLMWSRVWSWT